MRQISPPRVLSMNDSPSYNNRFLTFCGTAVVGFPMTEYEDDFDQVIEDELFIDMQETQIDPIANASRRSDLYESR